MRCYKTTVPSPDKVLDLADVVVCFVSAALLLYLERDSRRKVKEGSQTVSLTELCI